MSLELDRGKDGAENLIGDNINNKIRALLQLPVQSLRGECQHKESKGNRQTETGGSFQQQYKAGSAQAHCKTLPLVFPEKESPGDLYHQDSLCSQTSSGLAATSALEGTLTSRRGK